MNQQYFKELWIILHDLIGYCVYVYIDDIIVYSKNVNDHAQHLEQLFKLIKQAGLKFKPEKYHFRNERVELLGCIVSKEGTYQH